MQLPISHFPTPPSLDAAWRPTPCDINIIYTSLTSTFIGLQFVTDIIGLSSFV